MKSTKQKGSRNQKINTQDRCNSLKPRMQPFQLIQFVDEESGGLLEIDCVPDHWLDFDAAKDKCVTKFMPPPYSNTKSATLNSMIRQRRNPDPMWPTYEVELRGQADTYSLAMIRLDKLKNEQYAYTSETDVSKPEKSQQLLRILEKRKLERDGEKSKNDMQVPDISSSSEAASDYLNSSRSPTKFSPDSSIDERSKQKTLDCKTATLNRRLNRTKYEYHDLKSMRFTTPRTTVGLTTPQTIKDIENKKLIHNISKGHIKKNQSVQNIQEYDSPKSSRVSDSAKTTTSEARSSISQPIKRAAVVSQQMITLHEPSEDQPGRDLEIMKKDLKSIKADITSMKNEIAEMNNLLKDVLKREPAMRHVVFHEKHHLNIPFESVDEFIEFDINLSENEELRNDLIQALKLSIDSGVTISKTMIKIFRKYISRQVAMEYTAIRVTGTKRIMKDTRFCQCLQLAFQLKMADDPSFSEKTFYENLSSTIGNARDWDGNRLRRKRGELVP